MKILLASTAAYHDNFTGANKINRLIMEILAKKGHDCAVLALKNHLNALPVEVIEERTRTISIDKEEVNNVMVHTVDIAHSGELPTLRQAFESQIHEMEPDWVFVSSEDWGQFLLEAAIKNAPNCVIYLAYTPIALPFGPDSIMPNPAGKKLMRQTTAVIAVSQFLADYIKQWGNIDAYTVYPPAYGDGPFPWYQIDEGYVTMINPCMVKGISIFLEIAKRLPEVQFAAVLTWGTTENDKNALEALPNVTLLDPTVDIDSFLSKTKILLVPSLWNEAFGLVTVECLLRGIPVIASNAGGIPEAKLGTRFLIPVQPITEYELNQSLTLARDVPEQNIEPWVEAIQTLLTDTAVYQTESQASREAAHTFVNHLGVHQYEELLYELKTKVVEKEKELVNRIDQLSPDRLVLLKLLKKQQAEKKSEQIERYERPDGLAPLSLVQQRLWLIEQLTPSSPLYTIPFVARLEGEINEDALQKTLDALVKRHEALRTKIIVVDGEVKQHILDPQPVYIKRQNLDDIPHQEREHTAREWVTKAVRKPFVVQDGELFRATLIRQTDQIYYLVVTMHHIVSDGWSWGIFMREFSLLYQEYTQNIPANLSPLPIQYADYAMWQRTRFQKEKLAKQIDYWQTQLIDAPILLELPTDKPRSSTSSLAGNMIVVKVEKRLIDALRQFSQTHGVSLFMSMMTGFVALMSRYSRQDDLIIGIPVAGRSRVELESVFGFFVNTLPMRFKEISRLTGEELLQQVRERMLDGFANQDIPFDQIVELVAPERILNHMPLIQAHFSLQTESLQKHATSKMVLYPEEFNTKTAKFDLSVVAVEELDNSLSLFGEYRTDLYEAETIERLLQHYIELLTHLVADKTQPVKQLPILPAAERKLLLHTWNNTQRPYPQKDLVTLVQEQALKQPTAVALINGTTKIDYGTLVAKASQVAHLLQVRGVQRGDRVGLYLDRGTDLIEILLGILMAGAAYVPLDTDYPDNRLRLMVEDAQIQLIISDTTEGDWLIETKINLLTLDTIRQQQHTFPTSPPDIKLTLEDLAYIIYTSGSTGVPKGVAVPHRSIVRLVKETNYLTISSEDCIVQGSTISFDAATFEIWGALTNGARLLLISKTQLISPTELKNSLQQEKSVILFLTTSLFRQIAYTAPDFFEAVHCVLTGGEAGNINSMRLAMAQNPDMNLIHVYGPTETTTYTTFYDLGLLSDTAQVAPIGTPIANDQAFILDELLNPIPIGVPGELYISGAGVAWGYWDNPALTAQKFIPNPFSKQPGSRLYRTGDMVRWNSEGQIEFVGRVDHQIKLRGFRIELGEIEAVIARQPTVQEVSVIVREDEPSERHLVAYIVPIPDTNIEPDKLRQAIQKDLPDYMIPSIFFQLPRLPLNANGKLDRSMLPVPESHLLASGNSIVAPRTPMEEAMAEIWESLLNIENVGVHDNFFEVGGHSLQATHLIIKIEETFGVKISMRTLFDAPTVEGLTLSVTEQLMDAEDLNELDELLDLLEVEE